jgi:sulfoxide reductase heme-binding subunit YedZ
MQLSKFQGLDLWWVLFIGSLAPLVYILWAAFSTKLGAEPAKALVDFLGQTALIMLMLTLCITPLKKLAFLPSLIRYRRMIGLWVFFYAATHVLSYGLFLVDWTNFVEDLYKRPYITVGAFAFLVLLALAITSPKPVVRALGKKWKSLHQWIYLALVAVVIHVAWQARSDYSEAILYALGAAVLLYFRLPLLLQKLPFLNAK